MINYIELLKNNPEYFKQFSCKNLLFLNYDCPTKVKKLAKWSEHNYIYIQKHIDKQWTPVIITPPHPEFPAAHATLSNSAATALCSLFGENCAVTDNSYTDIGLKERTYTSLKNVAKEAGMSRLYGGIHYRYSIEQGFGLGERAARHVDTNVNFHSSN